MIIHRYPDGSEGYEYQVGDMVKITGVVGGGWFRYAIGRIGPVVNFDGCMSKRNRRWRVDSLYVKYSPDWGPSHCMPWQVKPTQETIEKAVLVRENE